MHHIISQFFIERNLLFIGSMAGKSKNEVGLPVNIYIDDSGTYRNSGHGKRFKFQMNKRNKAKEQPFASMSLYLDDYKTDKAFLKTYEKSKFKKELSSNDLKQVENFVKNNSYALDKIADQEIWMNQFDEVMIKGGEPASQEAIENQRILVDKFIEENE